MLGDNMKNKTYEVTCKLQDQEHAVRKKAQQNLEEKKFPGGHFYALGRFWRPFWKIIDRDVCKAEKCMDSVNTCQNVHVKLF